MQSVIVPLRYPSVTNSYPWLRETFNIIFLSKNLSWQDLRYCELDDDRCNDNMDHHYRFSAHIRMRYKFSCQLGNCSRNPRVLQRSESSFSWIRSDGFICRLDHTSTTYANSQYNDVLLPSKSDVLEGMAFADVTPAETCRLWSVASRLDVSMRK